MATEHAGQLREDARAIWQAGVDAVRSDGLVRAVIGRQGDELTVCGHRFDVSLLGQIAVVGAGKAGAGMAHAVEQALGHDLVAKKVVGWLNVPADCVRQLERIHLHAGRPRGVNEPTAEGVAGTRQILNLVAALSANDLCLVLLSGGGSALLPAPVPPITLADKQRVTRFLMHSGATIQQLNTVRKRLSQVKGGKLARASQASQLIALIISDIVGDPLDLIASGPTCPDPTTDAEAEAVLRQFAARPPQVPSRVLDFLRVAAQTARAEAAFPTNVFNHIIGCNATAVRAAAAKATALGYHVRNLGSDNAGQANAEGRALAQQCRALRDGDAQGPLPVCLLSGGEPVVQLAATNRPRQGGRNQQLVLAALLALKEVGMDRIALLSGGTDGEDGPTDAAGAVADAQLLQVAQQRGVDPRPYLEINDSYTFFQRTGGLLVTGATHTNVMDVRVALVAK